MEIIIRVSEKEYGKALSKALMTGLPGTVINLDNHYDKQEKSVFENDSKESALVISDIDTGSYSSTSSENDYEKDYFLLDRDRKLMPISDLIGELITYYENKHGHSTLLKTGNNTTVVNVASNAGGAGVTSLCIALSKRLRDKYRMKIALIKEGTYHELKYFFGSEYLPKRKASELEFRLQREDDFDLTPYMTVYENDLSICALENCCDELIERLVSSGIYDLILVDHGKKNLELTTFVGEMTIVVTDNHNLPAIYQQINGINNKVITVNNRSEDCGFLQGEDQSTTILNLINEPESFYFDKRHNQISILNNGMYFYGISLLAERIADEKQKADHDRFL